MTTEFNPLADGFVEWPYDQYADLRRNDPVHRSELLHGWVVTRYDDVGSLLRNPTVSSNIDTATPTPLTIDEIARRDEQARGGRTLVLLDDPEHARIRKLLAAPFRPREVAALQDRIVAKVAEHAEALAERAADSADGVVDLIDGYAYPLPVDIFCDLLKIPGEDHPQFRYWTGCVARALDPLLDEAERDRCLAGLDEMYGYLEELVGERRARPGDDLLSELVTAEVDGDRLEHADLMAQVMTLYVAGHEPTAGLVGNGMLGLLRHPDQLAELVSDRTLLGDALNEMLRYDGPNQFVRRITSEPTVLGDVEIPAGAVVYASPGSANHDPSVFGDDADTLVLRRPEANLHIQFGAGVHSCLGSFLAKAQAGAMLDALLTRWPTIELAGDPEWSPRMVIRGLNRLPVALTR